MEHLLSYELCAGAGGQALGLSRAGFQHVGLVDNDKSACLTLKENQPNWHVQFGGIETIQLTDKPELDLLAGGLPCPPFSIAGKLIGKDDERDLFPEAIRLIGESNPKAVMIENVRGLLDARFDD